MIGRTLGSYFALRFLKSIAAIFFIAFFIILLADLLEMLRQTADRPNFSWFKVLLVSLFKVPSLSEQVLPFATLFGAMAAFLSLSRRLELVVARAAGISVWQFTLPALLVALGLGVFAATVYNPGAAYLKARSDEIYIELSGAVARLAAQTTRDAWLTQDGKDGESILHARQSLDQGARLATVTAYLFDKTGRFRERIDADEARYQDGHWTLTNATVRTAEAGPQTFSTYAIATYLTLEQIRETLGAPDAVSFWALPSFIEAARNAGLPAFQYELQLQILLARPLLLAAMVLIAATVSLRVFRFGNIGRLILGGVGAGFVLYVAGEIARDLGSAGIVPPPLAAWSPAVVATLMGFTILLFQEDG